MIDLSVNFMGLNLKNPFLLAPGMYNTAVGFLPQFVEKIAEGGWAGVVTKPLQTLDWKWGYYPYPMLFTVQNTTSMEKKLREAMLMVNGGPGPAYVTNEKKDNLKPWIKGNAFTEKEIKDGIKSAHDYGLIVIGCLEPISTENAAFLAEKFQEWGFDGIDFNPSCPMILEFGIGTGPRAIGLDPEKMQKITRTIKESCNLPVMVKLSPHVSDFPTIAKAVEVAGADAVSAINTIRSIIGIDVDSGYPLSRPNSGGPGSPMGLSGPAILPMGLYAIWEIARTIGCDISGIGGIHDWKSAVQYIMLGATTVQVCTSVMYRGLQVGNEIVEGISKFMNEKGYKTIDDFRGIAVPRVMPYGKSLLISSRPSVAQINKDLCNGCGHCITSCSDNSGDCIKLVEYNGNKRAEVDEKDCTGCGLCSCVCPVQNCISFNTIPVQDFRMSS